jgi:gas vesicle protein
MGYVKGLSHGLALGIAIGVLTAPRSGVDTRQAIADAITRTRDTSQKVTDRVQQGWQAAQPALDKAAQAAGGVARAVQPVAQGATERFVELAGRADRSAPATYSPPPMSETKPPGFDSPNN